MDTPNINPIQVNVSQVSQKEVDRDEERHERRLAYQKEQATTDYQSKNLKGKVAGMAESMNPKEVKGKVFKGNTHEVLKETKSKVKSVLGEVEKLKKDGGADQNTKQVKQSSKESKSVILSDKIKEAKEFLEKELKTIEAKGDSLKPDQKEKKEKLSKIKADLETADQEYQQAFEKIDFSFEAKNVETSQSESETQGSFFEHPEAKELLTKIKSLVAGGDAKSLAEFDSMEALVNHVHQGLEGELSALKDQQADLLSKGNLIMDSLQKAKGSEKEGLTSELKKVQMELAHVLQKQKSLETKKADLSGHMDQLVALQTKKDLGVESELQTITDVDSMSTPENGQKDQTIKKLSISSYSEAKGNKQNSGQKSDSPLLRVRSTGGEAAPLSSSANQGSVESTGAPMLSVLDNSGTMMSIQSTSNSVQADAKKVDKVLKKLMQAVLSGNWEAIKSSLILLDKRAGQIMIGMGAQTIKAMQYYETQMNQLTKSMGDLKQAGNSEYSSQLAKINSQMNMYSMNRQAITNFMRETMTMREESSNITHSILQKDSQIGASASRFQ